MDLIGDFKFVPLATAIRRGVGRWGKAFLLAEEIYVTPKRGADTQ